MYTDVLHLLYSSFSWASLGYSGLLSWVAVQKKVENHWSEGTAWHSSTKIANSFNSKIFLNLHCFQVFVCFFPKSFSFHKNFRVFPNQAKNMFATFLRQA